MRMTLLRLIVVSFAAALLTSPVVTQAQSTLILAFNTSFSHSNHHWILWTPGHPVYEAAEVRIDGDPTTADTTVVRVFFTERAAPKGQVYYFKSEAVAKAWPYKAYYRPITFKTRPANP